MAKQGRLELLAWLNQYLETDYPKIESLCDGVAYCQLFDAILPPGTVPLHKLNFSAKFPEEYSKNYKILDEVFQKIGLTKPIPSEALIKGKFQENKEFLQWCHSYMLQKHSDGLPKYHAYQKREFAIRTRDNIDGKNPQPVLAPLNNNLLPNKFSSVNVQSNKQPKTTTTTTTSLTSDNTNNINNTNNTAKISKSKADSTAEKQAKELEQLIESLESELKETLLELHDFNKTVDGVKNDRDILFSKLRAIEELCTDKFADDPYAKTLLKIFSKEIPGFRQVVP